MSGTGRVLGATTSTVIVAAAVLSNIGGSMVIALAVALAAGLLAWGIVHAVANRTTA